MRYCSIASGSNGNCYYVEEGDDAVLIDIGINTKHVELRMARLGLLPEDIKAIFITHEHTDHVRGLSVFCKRYQIPVYLTEGTYKGTKLHLPEHLVRIIGVDSTTKIGKLEIIAIPKDHDAKEPCSFVVNDGVHNVAILTDIGKGCAHVRRAIASADVLLLESNYDVDLLQTGRYSYYLKNRISGGMGHVSNAVALELFLENKTDRLKHLILGHLSGENNTIDMVKETFEAHCETILMSIATRECESELFDLATVCSAKSKLSFC